MLGKLKATGGGVRQVIDREEAARALRLLVDRGHGCELRGITSRAGERPLVGSRVRRGTDVAGLVAAAEELADLKAIYHTLNPVPSRAKPFGTMNDEDVLFRHNLLLDIDPVRAESKTTDATQEEKGQAILLATAVMEELAGVDGWPAPTMFGDSGNGCYLNYRISLPNDDLSTAIVKSLLIRLAQRFDRPGAVIDTACYNASRIMKLMGTWSQKGDNSPERPFRRAFIIGADEAPVTVSLDLLKATARLSSSRPIEEQAKDAEAEQRARRRAAKEALKNGADVPIVVAAHDAETVVDLPLPEAPKNEFRKPLKATSGKAKDIEERAIAYIPFIDPAVEGQHGHDRALWAASCMVTGFLLTRDRALALLMEHYNPRCVPPFPEWELERKVDEAIAHPCDKPRGWLLIDTPNYKTNGTGHKNGKKESAKDEDVKWTILMDGEVVAEGKPEEVIGSPEHMPGGGGNRTFELCTIGNMIRTNYPEPKWIIKDVLSEGLNILAGAPKQGKSMLALNLALTIAGGGTALGDMPVEEAGVLYLSLEDKQRRVKARAIKMLRHLDKIDPKLASKIGSRLTITTEWPRQHEGGLLMLRQWIERTENPGLVIIDVWNRFSPPYDKKGGGTYQQDSENWGEVKGFLDRRDMNGLVIHHTRKPGAGGTPEDFVAELSGTFGVGGSADGILALIRSRSDSEASLHITGRDVPDKEIVLRFDPETLTWVGLGTKEAHIGGKVQTAVIAYLKSINGMTAFPKQIAEAISQDHESVRKACNRLHDMHLIRKSGNGWAWPGEAGTSSDTPF